METLDLDTAVDLTRTGDLWLFRGRSAADHAIRVLTNSPVNHVGMAVVLDDLPPLMWHAELGKGLLDQWTGTHHRGVQLHDLREAVYLSDRVFMMCARPGRITSINEVAFPRPRTPETAFMPQFVDIVHRLRDEISAVRAKK